jgi:hypothetical protein
VGGDLDIAIDDPARFAMSVATIELTGVGDEPSQSSEDLSRGSRARSTRDLGAVD